MNIIFTSLLAFFLSTTFAFENVVKDYFVDLSDAKLQRDLGTEYFASSYTEEEYRVNYSLKPTDWSVTIYPSSNQSCTSDALGNTSDNVHTITNTGTKTIWSETPLFNINDRYPDTYCNYSWEPCSMDSFNRGECIPKAMTYSFCSEKENKTVAICIYTQTKNENLSKQIFESFRWLDPTDIFNDVPLSHPQATAIKFMKDKNIVQGYEDSTFKPNNTINRSEFTKILTLAAALPSKKCDIPAFTDIETTAWYMPSLTLAYCHTLVQGYSTNEFKPSTNINAAEMYKIVAKAFAVPIVEDANSVWYMPYENALKNIDAIPKSITSADQFITRGEMAEVVYKVLNLQK